jgi:AcrR family transcriptional regulator
VVKARRSGPAATRLVEETIALIAEKGGSADVNLREVSRRAGFSHTNVYNYYPGFDGLMWAAFRRVLIHYGEYLAHDLDGSLSPAEYLERLLTNLETYPERNPGLYRFIGSDPLGPEFPPDILETVTVMKRWLFDAFKACAPGVDAAVVESATNIITAYVDGETFNLINERVVPGEDIRGRVVSNSTRLFVMLTGLAPPAVGTVDHPTPPWREEPFD